MGTERDETTDGEQEPRGWARDGGHSPPLGQMDRGGQITGGGLSFVHSRVGEPEGGYLRDYTLIG